MNVVIFGKRGTGKTTYCKNLVDKSILPVVVIDTMNEYQKECVLMNITDDIIFDKFKMRFVPKTDLDFVILNHLISNLRTSYGVNIVIDEIDYWTNPHFIPDEFSNNLRYSRHYRLNIYCTVRNPSEIHKRITGLTNTFIIFKITEPRYLEYFKDFDYSLPDKIRNLKTYEHIVYNL